MAVTVPFLKNRVATKKITDVSDIHGGGPSQNSLEVAKELLAEASSDVKASLTTLMETYAKIQKALHNLPDAWCIYFNSSDGSDVA